MPRCCEASGSVGPTGPEASRAPSALFRASRKRLRTAAYPAPTKEYGRRSVGLPRRNEGGLFERGNGLLVSVVPAQAGTHTPRRLMCAAEYGSRTPSPTLGRRGDSLANPSRDGGCAASHLRTTGEGAVLPRRRAGTLTKAVVSPGPWPRNPSRSKDSALHPGHVFGYIRPASGRGEAPSQSGHPRRPWRTGGDVLSRQPKKFEV